MKNRRQFLTLRPTSPATEIGSPPDDFRLYDRYRTNLARFAAECFELTDEGHRQAAKRLERAIFGRVVDVGTTPRPMVVAASIWAAGFGYRHFTVPRTTTKAAARALLDDIKFEFETNEKLLFVFPEACYAARALEGIPQRAAAQQIDGQRTRIEWSTRRCVLPTIAGFVGSAAVIWPRSIRDGISSLKFRRPDGAHATPDLIFWSVD
jgi:hypothetical protein